MSFSNDAFQERRLAIEAINGLTDNVVLRRCLKIIAFLMDLSIDVFNMYVNLVGILAILLVGIQFAVKYPVESAAIINIQTAPYQLVEQFIESVAIPVVGFALAFWLVATIPYMVRPFITIAFLMVLRRVQSNQTPTTEP